MPLVLAQNECSAADVRYADKLGTSYEFPAMYRNRMQPGESFVYYQGKRKTETAVQTPRYFGTGTIGSVSPVPNGRLCCEIEDYRPFDADVLFKQDGRYLEPGANGRLPRLVGVFFRQGVREIDHKTLDEITALGFEVR